MCIRDRYDVASETDGSIESLDVNTGGETAAETVTDDSGTVSVTTEVGNNENTAESAESVNDVITKAEESENAGEKTETKFLFINLAKAKGGTVILNEGELDDAGKSAEKRVKLVTQTDTDELGNETTKTLINVYDKDDVLIDSEDAADNANIYVCEVKTDEVVTVKVVADNGYVVSKYDLQDRLADGTKIDVGFDKTEGDELTVGEDTNENSASDKTEFSYPVFMKDNMALTIELEEKQEKTESTDDAKDDTAKDKEAVDDAGTAKDTDLTVDGEVAADDSKKDMDTDLTVGEEKTDEEAKDPEVSGSDEDNANAAEDGSEVTESVAGDAAGEDVNADEDDSADEESSGESVEDVNADETKESLGQEQADDIENINDNDVSVMPEQDTSNLDASDFTSRRLVLMADDDSIIIDKDYHLLGEYNNIYLLYYDTVNETMDAYQYYKSLAYAVEPDVVMAAADEENVNDAVTDVDITSFEVSDSTNPITTLDDEISTPVTSAKKEKVIALIDTGAEETQNVIGRVSFIDDNLSGTNSHGNEMVNAIVSQDKNAKILSIRALGDDGKGTISSIVAAMEYAISQNVDIINLSLYAKTNALNSVLEAEIEKADEEGIMVVGAAGNDGADVSNYMPGSVWQAIIIGACNEEGRRYPFSNYGENVAYYVNADSTSEAAAKFSGYLYSHSYISISPDNVLIFDTDEVEKKAVSNQIGMKSDKTIKMYYLFHDGTKEDKDTMHVISSMIGYKEYEVLEDGTISCKINPDPDLYDYNEDGMGTINEIDIDINRGGHGTGENKQTAITDECQYDEETGYLKVPAEYAGKDITVTVWQLSLIHISEPTRP